MTEHWSGRERKITVFVASFATKLFNRFSNKDSFILLIISPVIDNFFPVFILLSRDSSDGGGDCFDDIIGCLQDRLGRAINSLQEDDLSFLIILSKSRIFCIFCSPPAINRLVRIPNDRYFKAWGQEFDQLVLGMVGILILVYVDVLCEAAHEKTT